MDLQAQTEFDRVMSYLLPNHAFTCRDKPRDCKVTLRQRRQRGVGCVTTESFTTLIECMMKQTEVCTAYNLLLNDDVSAITALGIQVLQICHIRNCLCVTLDTHVSKELIVTLKTPSNLFQALAELFELLATLELHPSMSSGTQQAISLWNLMIKKLTQDARFKIWLAHICGVDFQYPNVKDYHYTTGYTRMVVALKIRLKQIQSDFDHIMIASKPIYMEIPELFVENLAYPKTIITTPFIQLNT